MTTTTLHRSPAAPAPTSREELCNHATCYVWHGEQPNAAGLLGISKDLAYSMARSGELPTIKLGRRVLVPVAKLLALLDA